MLDASAKSLERSDNKAGWERTVRVCEGCGKTGGGRVARMSGARGLMLFSKGSCLGPAAALTKNSLGGGVMGARDPSGPCGEAS